MIAKTPSLTNLDDVLPERSIAAMRAVSTGLRTLGVRHLLLGGMAVGVYGYPRNTQDVDFIIGPEGCVEATRAKPTSPRRARPRRRAGRPVDTLVLRDPAPLLDPVFVEDLDDALDHPLMVDGVPVAPLEVIVATAPARRRATSPTSSSCARLDLRR
ncbi:MAG: hypothetical protein R3A52_24615 [Polyangiales bacterium]